MKQFLLMFLILVTVASSNSYSQTKPQKNGAETLTNATVIELHKAGLDDDVIISKIGSSEGNFDLSTPKLIELKKAGISSAIIKALMSKTNSTGSKEMAKTPEKSISVELVNHPYYLDAAQNQYKPTEKATATMKTKSKMLGYGGTEVFYLIDGEQSPVRLLSSNNVSFIISTGGAPLPELTLYKLLTKKNSRQATTQKINGLSSSPLSGGASLSFDVSRLNDGVYKLIPTKALEKGEYFFAGKPIVSASSIDVFAFGID
jgi:hypothetical protein